MCVHVVWVVCSVSCLLIMLVAKFIIAACALETCMSRPYECRQRAFCTCFNEEISAVQVMPYVLVYGNIHAQMEPKGVRASAVLRARSIRKSYCHESCVKRANVRC